MKKLILAGLLTLFLQGSGLAAPDQLFYQGNSAYKEGKYDAAIENYEKIIASGLESGNLYFNLGNSFFKIGETGKAILNYERAKLFIPNDSDLKSNYEYVLSSLNLEPQSFGNRFERSAGRLFEGVTINFLTIFLSVIYVLVIAAFMLNLFPAGLKQFLKPLIVILAALFILAAVSLRNKVTYFNAGAVVISKTADAKFEPLESATTYFKLTEGSIAEVIEEADSWYKIKRPDGKLGWVNKEALIMVKSGV